MNFATMWWRGYQHDDVQRLEPFSKGVICSVEVAPTSINRLALVLFFGRYADENTKRTCRPSITRVNR